MLMSEFEIDKLKKETGQYVTRKCNYCFNPIVGAVTFRYSEKEYKARNIKSVNGFDWDDVDICSKQHFEKWIDQIEKDKKEKSKMSSKSKKDREDEDEEDEEVVEDGDEGGDEDEGDDDESSDEDEDDEEDEKPKKKKKSSKPAKKKSKKSKDEDEDEDEDDDEDEKPKKNKGAKSSKSAGKKKKSGPPEYDPKEPIGKMYDRLKGGKWVSKKDLYKGLGENAGKLLAWITIHGNKSGAWEIKKDDDKGIKMVKS